MWEAKGIQRVLFRRGETGWHWTRRAEIVYTLLARWSR